MAPLSRRTFLGSALAAGGAAAVAGTATDADARVARPPRDVAPASSDPTAPETSTFFATAKLEYYGSLATDSDGDLWPSCWADDGAIYAANGDGRGFSDADGADIVMNRIAGTPATTITGTRLAAGDQLGPVWSDPANYNRKPTGMVCVDGVLYLAIQDLKYGEGAFSDAPAASISRSVDHGRTWQPSASPMFHDYRFTTVFFLDFGRDSQHARAALGAADAQYVYAYGLDWNWRDSFGDTVTDPTKVYLARVPKAHVQDRSRWTFFTGADRHGRPTWSADIVDKVAVLHDERRLYSTLRPAETDPHCLSVVSQGGVVYNAPLRRYLYTSWTEYTFEFYESPTPWGPWRLFLHHDAGGYPWFGMGDGVPGPKNGGYAATIPSKFISADGRSMWVQSNWFVGNGGGTNNYQFNLRRLHLETATRRRVAGPPAGTNLARVAGVVATEKSAHYGHASYYNDGDRTQSEDSFDQSNKELDWWGYTWPRRYRLGRVEYTTGTMFPDGGWFSAYDGGLRVQVRDGAHWRDVDGLRISPDYPYDASAGPTKTYRLTFDPVVGDGLRIIGPPGGAATFTSIAELAVYG